MAHKGWTVLFFLIFFQHVYLLVLWSIIHDDHCMIDHIDNRAYPGSRASFFFLSPVFRPFSSTITKSKKQKPRTKESIRLFRPLSIYILQCRSTYSHATMNMYNLVTHKNATKEIIKRRKKKKKPRAGWLDLVPIPSHSSCLVEYEIQRVYSVLHTPYYTWEIILLFESMHPQCAIPVRANELVSNQITVKWNADQTRCKYAARG